MHSGAQTDPGRPRVLFIRGITTRSGTNYLRDLLMLHPDVARARHGLWEDFCLDQAGRFDEYFAGMAHRWPEMWKVPLPEVRARLFRELGDALVRALIANPDRPEALIAAKSPSVRGLAYFFELFPDDHLIVLVRDGRSVVESKMRSFNQSFDSAAREWAANADTILKFRQAHAATEGKRWALLRYEDVMTDVATAFERVAAVTGLDPTAVDPAAADALPVRGSSSFQRDEDPVHWRRVERDDSFNPLERAADWDDERHRHFNWLAGEQMLGLGYSLTGPTHPGLRDRLEYQSIELTHRMRKMAVRTRRSMAGRPAVGAPTAGGSVSRA